MAVTKWFNRDMYILAPFILFLHSMKQELFSSILEKAFGVAASEHGWHYPEGGARAWGITGASYLGFAVCGLPLSELRRIQYLTREQYGAVILDCKWYDMLKAMCLDGRESVETLLPGPDGNPCQCQVTGELFLEMLDFCREG